MNVAIYSQRRSHVARNRTAATIVDRRLGELDEHVRRGTMQPPWRRALSALFTGLILAGVVYLWPARLGGSTYMVVVRGTSMVPAFDINDVVVSRKADSYNVGDIAVFSIPDGVGEGMLVIHRIVGQREDGTWITQGDNRDTVDQFILRDADLKGKPQIVLPHAGRLLSLASNTFVISSAIGLLTIVLLWPKRRQQAVVSDADRFATELAHVDVAAEAEAWLAQELSRLGVVI